MDKTAFIYSDKFAGYKYGESHPFKPERARLTLERCQQLKLLDKPWMEVVEPKPADPRTVALFHDQAYLEMLKQANDGVFRDEMIEFGLGTVDCPVFPGVYDYSLMTTGATLLAAQLVEEGYKAAFNVAGGLHHAQPRSAEGFCYVNDIVVAILQLLDRGRRVAYVDIDVHHGDGVQNAFYEDDRVLTISVHESGRTLFPWGGFETEIGLGAGMGYNINMPLPADTDDELFLWAFNEIAPPAVTAFAPDLIFAVLGTDTLLYDPLAHFSMTNNGFAEAVQALMSLSYGCVALGGGGYNVDSAVRAWTLAWSIMNGIEPQDTYIGVIGGMMLGTEYLEGGSLRDRHVYTTGPRKEEIRREAERVVSYIKDTVFPLLKVAP